LTILEAEQSVDCRLGVSSVYFLNEQPDGALILHFYPTTAHFVSSDAVGTPPRRSRRERRSTHSCCPRRIQ